MNYGICKLCGLEKQFPTPEEQARIMAKALYRSGVTEPPEAVTIDIGILENVVLAGKVIGGI